MTIAFFDSGIGGVSVLHESQKLLPNQHYIYFADSDHVPYGTKSKQEILALVHDAVDFLVSQNIDALVLACNTATSVAVSSLRAKYSFPIIGMEPAVKPALALDADKKVLVCATDLTLREKKLELLVSKLEAEDRVVLLSLQKLVMMAEAKIFESDEVKEYLRKCFEDVPWKEYSSVVLGCTHFIYYKKLISTMIPTNVKIVDGNLGTVSNLKSKLTSKDNINTPKMGLKFYASKRELPIEQLDHLFKILKD